MGEGSILRVIRRYRRRRCCTCRRMYALARSRPLAPSFTRCCPVAVRTPILIPTSPFTHCCPAAATAALLLLLQLLLLLLPCIRRPRSRSFSLACWRRCCRCHCCCRRVCAHWPSSVCVRARFLFCLWYYQCL